MTEISRLAYLFAQNKRGTITKEEKEELEEWRAKSPENPALLDKYMQPKMTLDILRALHAVRDKAIRNKLWEQFDAAPKKGHPR